MKIVIVGAGEVGFHFAEWLALENKEIVVIDKNPAALKWVLEHLDVQTLHGSGSDPKILEEAGVRKADVLLAATDSDEVNIISCFFANLLAPGLNKVALVRNQEYAAYQDALTRTINSTVINPDRELISSMLRLLSAPDADEINDFVGGRIKMIGKHLPPESPLAGLRLLQIPEKIGKLPMIIAALVREDRLIIPKGKDVLKAGDFVYFVCESQDLDKVMRLFGRTPYSLKNLMIVGGGNIGFRLARELEQQRYHVKLIERDPERCQILSAQLHRTIVLHGYATDQEFLDQENIGHMDLVAALTRDEEMNILSCLLAKRLGAKKTVARINKFAYMPLVKLIGIDHIVSPRLSAINCIFPYMRRGKVVSTVSIKGKEAEVLEAVALPDSEIVGRPLKDLKFPKEALILCILCGEEVIIPTGDSVIRPQDRVIILSTRQNLPAVEQFLAVKGEA